MRADVFRPRTAAVSAIVVLVLAAGVAAQGGAQKSALVTVVADNGARTKDLTAKDFVVHEDKSERQVVAAELATEPLSVTIFVDTTQPPMGMPTATQDLRTALTNFVKTVQAAGADTQIAVMECAGAATTVLDFTQKADDLEKTVQHLFPNQQSGAVLLEALSEASRKLAEKPAPRRAIVTVDFNSREDSASQLLKKVADDVRKSGATVWSVSVRGTNESASTREAVLTAVTQASGGLRLTAVEPSGLDGMLAKVANSITSQYTVTFARPDASAMKPVKMETRGAKVLLSPWLR